MKFTDPQDNYNAYDVLIIGGGLAGLTSAIHLSLNNCSVLVIEKNSFPRHKVCGEYVSNEVVPYLKSLGIDPKDHGAKQINEFELSTAKGKIAKTQLPLGGFGISRYAFDSILAKHAKINGAEIIQDEVVEVDFYNEKFTIKTKKKLVFRCRIALGAYGKRSLLDIKLNRKFISNTAPFLAVKNHTQGEFPANKVALHIFKGGYCGVSVVENDRINLCYITELKAFKKYSGIAEFQEKVIFENKILRTLFTQTKPVFDAPLSISQISFAPKKPVENHVLMCGDTAGLIHPLCGNGMSMAIRSAAIACHLISEFINSDRLSRTELERKYRLAWNKEFRTRLKVGSFIAFLFRQDRLAEYLIKIIDWFPELLPKIIQFTHGKPMLAK